MRTEYLHAEETLAQVARQARLSRDYDTLCRVMLPLQEARRQRRQRAGEGVVCLDILAAGPNDTLDAEKLADEFPHGQLLVAGWGTVLPAANLRRIAWDRRLYLDTFLAAVYPTHTTNLIAIMPEADARLPIPTPRSADELKRLLPPHSLVLTPDQLPRGPHQGTAETFSFVMNLWEQLHAPYLAAAEAEPNLSNKITACEKTIDVDYACELAHQKLATAAKSLNRHSR